MAEQYCYLVCPKYTPPRFWVITTHEETNNSETHEVTDWDGPSNVGEFLEICRYQGFSFKLFTSSRELRGPWSGEWKSVFEDFGQPSLRSKPELNAPEPSVCRVAKFPTGTCHPSDLKCISLVMMKAYTKTAECRALYDPSYDDELTIRRYGRDVMQRVMVIDELEAGSSLYYASHVGRFIAACLLREPQIGHNRPTMESLREAITLAHANTLDMDMALEICREDYDTIQSRSSSGSAQDAQSCLFMTLFTFLKKYDTMEEASPAVCDRTFSIIPVDTNVDFYSILLKNAIDDIGHKRDIYVRCSDPDSAPCLLKYGFDEIGRTVFQPKGQPQLSFISIRMFRKAGPWALRDADVLPTPIAGNTQHQAQSQQMQGNSHSHLELQEQGIMSNHPITVSDDKDETDLNSQSGNVGVAAAAGKSKPREFLFVMENP